MANQIVDLIACDVSMPASVVQTARHFRRRTTHPPDRQIGNGSFAIDQDDHLRDDATQEVLAIAIGSCWRMPYGFEVRPDAT
jgi:hypothetical protein